LQVRGGLAGLARMHAQLPGVHACAAAAQPRSGCSCRRAAWRPWLEGAAQRCVQPRMHPAPPARRALALPAQRAAMHLRADPRTYAGRSAAPPPASARPPCSMWQTARSRSPARSCATTLCCRWWCSARWRGTAPLPLLQLQLTRRTAWTPRACRSWRGWSARRWGCSCRSAPLRATARCCSASWSRAPLWSAPSAGPRRAAGLPACRCPAPARAAAGRHCCRRPPPAG
jgi:hypothetical protein